MIVKILSVTLPTSPITIPTPTPSPELSTLTVVTVDLNNGVTQDFAVVNIDDLKAQIKLKLQQDSDTQSLIDLAGQKMNI